MKYLFLFGHGPDGKGYTDPGATGHGINERDFLRGDFQKSLIKYMDRTGKPFKIYDLNAYKTKLISTFKPRQYNITEFHMDGANSSKAKGGHVIIHDEYKPDVEDKKLRNVLGKWFGLRWGSKEHGINGRANIYNCNQARKTNNTYRLLELGFVTNKENTVTFKQNYDEIAKNIVEALTGVNVTQDVDICPHCKRPF